VLYAFAASFTFKISFAGFGNTLKVVFVALNEKSLAVLTFEIAAEFIKRICSIAISACQVVAVIRLKRY
jgi:hypothetical protein